MAARVARIVLMLLFITSASDALAANKEREPVRTVEVDLSTATFKAYLPFDETFLILGDVPKGVSRIKVTYGTTHDITGHKAAGEWKQLEGITEDEFAVAIPPLRHSTRYHFSFRFLKDKLSDKEVEAFQERARHVLDVELRRVGEEGLTGDEFTDVQTDLREAVTPPGYVLIDGGLLEETDLLESAIGFEPIMSLQADRLMIVENIQDRLGEQKGSAGTLGSEKKALAETLDPPSSVWSAEEASAAIDLIRAAQATIPEGQKGIGTTLGDLEHEYDRLRGSLTTRNRLIEEALEMLGVVAAKEVSVRGSTSGSFKTRAMWHVAQDLGFAWAPGLDRAVPFFGLNIYTRPINRDAPIRGLRQRFAFTIGVTLQSVAESGRRDDILSGITPLIGAGLRLTEFTRLSGGVLLFEKDDPNPLVTDWEITGEGYVALGLDIEFKDLISRFGSAFK